MPAVNDRIPWIRCILTAVFDVDQGQKVTFTYPHDTCTEQEEQDIAYIAFPDSYRDDSESESSITDSSYFVRIRRRSRADQFLYCYTFSRRYRDERATRGCNYAAAVLVSELPHTSILLCAAVAWGPRLLYHPAQSARALFVEAATVWPHPEPYRLLRVPLGLDTIAGSVCAPCCLPVQHLPQRPRSLGTPADAGASGVKLTNVVAAASLGMIGLFPDVDVAMVLQPYLAHLWTLWEIMMLGEPLLVFSHRPEDCSQIVAALVALITPHPYLLDFRPLFSLHDPDVASVMESSPTESASSRPMVIGVTNAHFLRACGAFPNVLIAPGAPAPLSTQSNKRGSESDLQRVSSGSLAVPSITSFFHADTLIDAATQGKPVAWLRLQGHCSSADKQVLAKAKLPEGSRSDGLAYKSAWGPLISAGSRVLRQHFFVLTSSFLAPFYSYYGISPPWSDPSMSSTHKAHESAFQVQGMFVVSTFLKFLQSAGTPEAVLHYTGGARKARSLYIAYTNSEHFPLWISRLLQDSGLDQQANAVSNVTVEYDRS